MGGKKKAPAPKPKGPFPEKIVPSPPAADMDNAAVRGTKTQWQTQEEWIEELKKEGYTDFYAKPSKPDPNPPQPDPSWTEKKKLAFAKKEHTVPPRGAKAYGSDELGKELEKIYPSGGPDLVAVDPKKKKMLAGDVTARSSSGGEMYRPGDKRRLPNELEAEDLQVHHLDKTKRDAVRLSENLPDKYRDYDIEFQDRYSEDAERKASARFKVKRKVKPATPEAKGIAGSRPTAEERGTGPDPDKKRQAKKKAGKKAQKKVENVAADEAKKKAEQEAAAKAEKKAADAAKKKAAKEAEEKAAAAAKKKAATKEAADAAAKKKAAEDAAAQAQKRAARKAEEEAVDAAKKKAAKEAEERAVEAAKKKAAKEAEERAIDAAKKKAAKEAEEKAAEEARQRAIKAAEAKAAKEAEEAAAAKLAKEAEAAAAKRALAKGERKLSRIPLKFKLKLKSGLLFLLEIGFDLFVGWLENKHIQGMISDAIESNSDKIEAVLGSQLVSDEIEKFRSGEKLEKGYQLYLYVTIFMTRHCSDGGCGFSGYLDKVYFNNVKYSRTPQREFFPEADEEEGWDANFNGMYGANATFNVPIFEHGFSISNGTEDAADGRFDTFIKTFVNREGKSTGDYTVAYFDAFRQYAVFKVNSKSNEIYNLKWGMNDWLVDITLVELGRKNPLELLGPPNNMEFETVINTVRWGIATKMLFIVDVYNLVMTMTEDWQIYYLEKYDKYFRMMDNGYTKCQVSCHTLIGDKRIIHRITADDVKAQQRARSFVTGQSQFDRPQLDRLLNRGK